MVEWYWNYLKSIYVLLHYKNGRNLKMFAGKKVMKSEECHEWLRQRLETPGIPFCACRFGAVELNIIRKMLAPYVGRKKRELAYRLFCMNAGFFYRDENEIRQFSDLVISLLPQADLLAQWDLPMEEYIVKKYCKKDMYITHLSSFGVSDREDAWTLALKGKKVLIIHPFIDSVKKQYQIKDKLFQNQILPDFELICIKAVQTIASEKDNRFDTWLSALNYMYEQAMRIDFDVALIGCGAYGMPLALKIKKAGRSAIHLGGELQIYFGIKGKRWDDCGVYNKYWCRPQEDERPVNSEMIENGCYW